jgi:hypothetical protein
MNHKRRRPKSQRAGCLLCKSHKHESCAKTTSVKGRKGKIKKSELDKERDE